MSRPFTTTLRARPGAVRIGSPSDATIAFRVQVLEAWDTVTVEAPVDSAVATVKAQALTALVPGSHPEDYVAKLGGWEVLDEAASLHAAGIAAGSTVLLMLRRRRPVR